MTFRHLLSASILTATVAALSATAAAEDLDGGFFILNEDWYGHQNSTINYLRPDDPDGVYWDYRVFQSRNPGKELGCTAQHGIAWGGRLYLIAKQEKDPGASIVGARITVCDAKTMECLAQLTEIDPSGKRCDGRGACGVSLEKVYISSSNGIWIFDTRSLTITGQIPGTENPNGTGGATTDPSGALYKGQCGTMVSAEGRVFAAHQQSGLLIIDPTTDKVIKTISMDVVQDGAGIGSIVKDRTGILWISTDKNIRGTGNPLRKLVRLNPKTLEYDIITLPDDVLPPNNSWYAWTPDAFCASAGQDYLYWRANAGKGQAAWFNGVYLYRFNTVTRKAEVIRNFKEEGAGWSIYGCSLRVHPVTDEIYMSLYQGNQKTTYITRRCDADGNTIKDYPMIANYWFPSLPIFTEDDPYPLSVSDITIDDSASAPIEYYNFQGIRVASEDGTSLPAGVYIRRQGTHTSKILVR